MQQVACFSAAEHGIDKPEIDQILIASRAQNAGHGITGILLATNGAFFQVLEGETAEIEETLH